ncbi:MAG: hypothetical protein ACE5F1_01445 [Planctomycetota bacterium]
MASSIEWRRWAAAQRFIRDRDGSLLLDLAPIAESCHHFRATVGHPAGCDGTMLIETQTFAFMVITGDDDLAVVPGNDRSAWGAGVDR